MTQNIKNFIENGEKEFEEKFGFLNNIIESHCIIGAKEWNWGKEIKRFIYSRQISLIKMIVEMVESEKKNMASVSDIDNEIYQAQHLGYKTALDTISSKLKTLTDGK